MTDAYCDLDGNLRTRITAPDGLRYWHCGWCKADEPITDPIREALQRDMDPREHP